MLQGEQIVSGDEIRVLCEHGLKSMNKSGLIRYLHFSKGMIMGYAHGSLRLKNLRVKPTGVRNDFQMKRDSLSRICARYIHSYCNLHTLWKSPYKQISLTRR